MWNFALLCWFTLFCRETIFAANLRTFECKNLQALESASVKKETNIRYATHATLTSTELACLRGLLIHKHKCNCCKKVSKLVHANKSDCGPFVKMLEGKTIIISYSCSLLVEFKFCIKSKTICARFSPPQNEKMLALSWEILIWRQLKASHPMKCCVLARAGEIILAPRPRLGLI